VVEKVKKYDFSLIFSGKNIITQRKNFSNLNLRLILKARTQTDPFRASAQPAIAESEDMALKPSENRPKIGFLTHIKKKKIHNSAKNFF